MVETVPSSLVCNWVCKPLICFLPRYQFIFGEGRAPLALQLMLQ